MAPSRPSKPRALSSFHYMPHEHKKDQDVHIDMQYAKHGFTDQLEFAKEPWKHCDNHTNCYLALRFDRRNEFKKKLKEMDEKHNLKLQNMESEREIYEMDEEFQSRLRAMQEKGRGKKLERVVHEEERIRQTRINFTNDPKNPKKKRMMARLKSAKLAWKAEVKERREEYIDKIKSLPKFPRSWTRNQELDIELLERVAAWKVEDDPEEENSQQDPEEEYGFKACAIYFQKSRNGWEPHTHDHPKFKDGKFPNQKISVHDLIQKATDNPLSEPCDDDKLRYFHFPSNNMRWIEVRIENRSLTQN
jgi:hypothetical protein